MSVGLLCVGEVGVKGGVGWVVLLELTRHRVEGWVARAVYNGPNQTLPMHSAVSETQTQYELQQANKWQGIAARPTDAWREPNPMEEFFIEHYWGYNRQTDGGTMEYEVAHPKWRTRPAELARFDLDVETLYGSEWLSTLTRKPDSVVLADGSDVVVLSGKRF